MNSINSLDSIYIVTRNGVQYIDLPYQKVEDYISKNGKDQTIKELSNLAKQLGFPYKRHFMSNPMYYFNNLFKIDVTLATKEFRFKNLIPKMGMNQFEKLFDYKYKHKYLYIRDSYDIYTKVNMLTDYFTEEPRIKSTGHGQAISPYEYWQQHTYDVVKEAVDKKQDINAFVLREILYETVYEARMGKISQYYTLLKYFNVKKFLDPSCAWGDRLIAAIAHNCTYYGIDPNTDLKKGHDEIIATFCPKENVENYKMIYKPIEDVSIKSLPLFDFILSSPAPFEGDVYGNKVGQSTENYKEFNTWFIKYMYFTCRASYRVLEDKGHFLITILDRLYPKEYAIVELLLLTILFKCKYMFYKGVIGWEGSKGKVIPFWVFQRRNGKKTKRKRTTAGQYLEQLYPDVYKLLL